MERQPRTKPAARNAMRVTIRTPPDKKRSPRKNAEKQPLRSPSRRAPSATSKLTIRERFILSFSVPLILVSLGLLTFIASHVIAKMVGRAKARKAERIATAYVDLLNATHASTATSEAAILIASETASLGAAAPLNVSKTTVTSSTIPGFIEVFVRKGHRLEGGWRPLTIAPKMLDHYPGPPSDNAVAPGTIGSAVHIEGAVTPNELAPITAGEDSGRGIGVDAVTASTTAAHVVESVRRSYVNRELSAISGRHFLPNMKGSDLNLIPELRTEGPERTDAVWRTKVSAYTAAETKTREVSRAGDGGPAFPANARPSGTSDTPLGGPHLVPGAAGRTPPGALTADFGPYQKRYEDTGSAVANGIVSGDLTSVGPPFPDNMEATARAPSSTTALHAASLFDVPPVDDGISFTSTAIDAPTIHNRSAFITAADNTKMVDLVPLQVITRAETSSQAASTGTQVGLSSTASTPADMIAIQQTLVPVDGDGDTPSLTSMRMVPSEQPQERTRAISGTFTSTSTTLEGDAQFGTTTAGDTIEKMVTPQYMLIDMGGTTLKDEELRSELFFNSTELATSGTASQVKMFVSNERAGGANSRAKTTAPSTGTGRNATSGRAQVPIAKTSSDHTVKQRNSGNFLNDISTPEGMIVIQQTFMPMEADTQPLTSVSLANGANEISDETPRSTGVDDKSNTGHVPIVTTTKNQTKRVSGADEVGAGVDARWSGKTSAREVATPNHSNGFATCASRIYPTVENSPKTYTEQSTARNAMGSPITIEYGCTNVDSLYTSRDVLLKGTNQHATSVSTPIVDRDASVQVKPTGKDLQTMHTSNHRPSTAATVRAMTMLPGYLRTGARINQGTTTPVSEPNVPSVSKSRPSRNPRRVLPTTAVSVTASILKDPSTALPRARVRSPMVTSTLYRTVSLPITISAPRKIQHVNIFTTIAPPIVISGTNLSEAKVFRDVRSSRDSARWNTTIPAMIIQTAMTGDRVTNAGKPETTIREARVASYVRVPTLDKITPPVTWVNNSAVHIPANAARSTMEVTESWSTVSGEKTTTVTNTVPNWVRVDTRYTREKGNVIIRTWERRPATTNVATSAGPEIILRLAKDTATVRDVDKKNVAEAESTSNGNGSFTAFTKALSDVEAPTQNSRDSRNTDTTTTRNPVVVDASSEAPADVASPFGPSEPRRQKRTFPAWSIGGALNANMSPIAAFGKTRVNAAHSEVKLVTAWRIPTAATRRSVSVMTSASRARGDVTPRNSSSIYWFVTASATRRSMSAMASAATARGGATPASSRHDNRGSGTIIPAMIMQTAMTRLRTTTAAKPETAIRLRVSASDIKAPSARLKNSGVRISANAEGRPSFTTALETRRFSQGEVVTTDKRMQPAWPIVSALTRRLLPITRSFATFRRSSPVGSARTTGSVETRTFPAMPIEHAAKGSTLSRLTKRASGTREMPVHGLDNIDDFDRNPTRTRRVNDSVLVDVFGPSTDTARREDQRRTEEHVSDGKTATAWPILEAIRMRSPRPAVHSRPVNDTSGWVRKVPSSVGLLRAATTRVKQLAAKVHGFAVIETPPPRSTDKAVRANYLRR